MDQAGNIVIYGATFMVVVAALAALGRCGAVTEGGTHWYGIVPRKCIIGRVIGGLHVTAAVVAVVAILSLSCGLLLLYLFNLVSAYI